MNLKKLKVAMAKGRIKAIIKNVAGRRMLVGYERVSKQSRKAKVIHIHAPVDLDKLAKEQGQRKPASQPAPDYMPEMVRPSAMEMAAAPDPGPILDAMFPPRPSRPIAPPSPPPTP